MTAKNSPIKRLALFDLDHTLIPIDSDYEWGNFMVKKGLVDAQKASTLNDKFYADYCSGKLNMDDYVAFTTKVIRQLGPAKSAQLHDDFMREVIQPNLRSNVLALLQQHRAQEDCIVIITATNEFVAAPIAKALGVSELIAVELERGADNWFTGRISGIPSIGQGKVTRMQQWLQQQDLSWDSVYATFYSDSHNDIPLLKQVNVPIATNPDPILRKHALAHDWSIMELFQSSD